MDKNRIMLKIRELENFLEEVKTILPKNMEVYLNSLEKRRSIERELQMMIESVIDICMLLIKELHLKIPNSEESIFEILKDRLSNIENLKLMRKFRNILVHKYGKINDELVFNFANEDIKDFHVFISDVKRILSSNNK